jgi:hypothetical protein
MAYNVQYFGSFGEGSSAAIPSAMGQLRVQVQQCVHDEQLSDWWPTNNISNDEIPIESDALMNEIYGPDKLPSY